MGEVYRARDARLGRDVAIKILPASVAEDPERLARFEREARVLASVNHPHIASIYGFEEAAGIRALVLELVEGDTLEGRLANGPLPVTEALGIARQIADALEAAHERGIVHRDLKPANIKVTPAGVVKVLDFGIAKAGAGRDVASVMQTATTLATTGMVVGTAPYMSPEQARGAALDKRTDIWAFGCVLFEMLSGRRLFKGTTATDVLVSIVERPPDWTGLPAATPSALRRLLQRLVEKDPRARLHDIADARIEIEDILQGRSIEPEAVRPPGQSRLAWALALGALALAIAAGVTALSTRRAVADLTRVPTIVRASRLTNTPAQEFGSSISADGKWIAYYSDASGRTDLWVKILDNGSTLNLTERRDLLLPVRGMIGGVDISPDGQLIAFSARQTAAGNPTLDTWVMDAPLGGPPRRIAQGIQAMRWSPDGKRLVGMRAGASAGDSLWVVDRDGSNLREVIPVRSGRHIHWPTWSRDGGFIYFIDSFITWHDEPSEIWRVPATGGTPEAVVPSHRRAIYPVPMPEGRGLIFAANPSTVDLGLWWSPPEGGDPRPLTTGVGEHTELYVSADGRRLVATLMELRQSLVAFDVTPGRVPEGRALTNGYTGDLYPAVDPREGRLAFSSSRSGNRNLWIAKADGTNATPLTSQAAIDERPVFSPDGQRLAFVSDRDGQRGIWVMGADSGTPRLVGHALVLDTLTWSPDGRRVVFSTPGESLPRLAAMVVDTGAVEAFPTPGAAHSPSWSAVTDRIAYLEATPATATTRSQTYIAFVDSRGQRLYPDLPKTATFANGFLEWAPDGKKVAVVAAQSNIAASIWIVEPDAREPFRKLLELPVSVRPRGITWSADGSSVIIAKQEMPSDIVLFDLKK
jgi:serine/threonine protein kinase